MDAGHFNRRDLLKSAVALGAASLPLELAANHAAAADKSASTWVDKATVKLNGLTVTLSQPALIKRSRWFCWFPSLIRQSDGTLWAIISAYADEHVSDSFSYLSRSKDNGVTWDEPRVIGDSGLNHLLLADGTALVLPYYMRPRGEGKIGAPCNLISPKGQLRMRAAGVNVSGWPKPVKSLGADLATSAFVFNGQVVRGTKEEYLTTLYGHFEGEGRYSLVFAESPDGYAWKIRSLIAGADCPLEGGEGPCEAAVCRLKDGRLMCVFRLASYVPYGQVFSSDDGQTWTKPVPIKPHSVEPSLAVFPTGTVALSGGRPGIAVWFNGDGTGQEWQSVDIVAHHNACLPKDAINPDSRKATVKTEDMLKQGLHGFTSSYTELVRLDDKHLLLIYDRLGMGWHAIPDESEETNSVWAVRLRVE